MLDSVFPRKMIRFLFCFVIETAADVGLCPNTRAVITRISVAEIGKIRNSARAQNFLAIARHGSILAADP